MMKIIQGVANWYSKVTDDVHVDWHMTSDEWGQLKQVLTSHAAESEYVSCLIDEGKL